MASKRCMSSAIWARYSRKFSIVTWRSALDGGARGSAHASSPPSSSRCGEDHNAVYSPWYRRLATDSSASLCARAVFVRGASHAKHTCAGEKGTGASSRHTRLPTGLCGAWGGGGSAPVRVVQHRGQRVCEGKAARAAPSLSRHLRQVTPAKSDGKGEKQKKNGLRLVSSDSKRESQNKPNQQWQHGDKAW